jgi:hypothetical protein
MRILIVFVALLIVPSVAHAAKCFPARSDVVSLGEKAARAYSEASLDDSISQQRQLLDSLGEKAPAAVRKTLDCKPFPNVLGADEWRCVGSAKVCSGPEVTAATPQTKKPKKAN